MGIPWGNFDKPPQSYWIASVQFPQFEQLNDDIDVDVAIIGGGIVGIASAFMLKQSGLKVAVLEAAKILHGTTGYTTGKITAQHDIIYTTIKANMSQENAQQYADANKAAILAIHESIKQNNIQCDFSWQPAYIYTQDEKEIKTIQDEANLAASLGFKASYLEEIPLPIDVKAALRFDDQAQFHPLKYLLAVANLIPDGGSHIYENVIAMDIQKENGYLVTTNTGRRVKAPHVIIASHYPFHDGGGQYFTRLHPNRSYALGIKIKEKFPGGIYITAEDPARSFRSTPLPDGGELVLVVGEHHNTGQSPDTSVHYQNLLETAESLFTLDEVLYRWSAQDYITMDQVPYIGSLSPDTPGIYVATGFRKWGISTSVAAAMIIKDYINGKDNPWAPVFDPTRFKPDAATDKVMVQKTDLAKKMTDSKLMPSASKDDIPLGTAMVSDTNGKRIGTFKDSQDGFHTVELVCTHMGCEPQWDSAEQSWDCPCHGSRFTYDGDLIEGPAKQPLNKPANQAGTLK